MKKFFSNHKIITHHLLKASPCLGVFKMGCESKPINGRGASAGCRKARKGKMPVSYSQNFFLQIPLQGYLVVPM